MSCVACSAAVFAKRPRYQKRFVYFNRNCSDVFYQLVFLYFPTTIRYGIDFALVSEFPSSVVH